MKSRSAAFFVMALAAVASDAATPVETLSLDEKTAQLQAAAPAIPRLGVRAYNWWNEGLHGLARTGYATVFPQAIGLAATWDAKLLEGAGDVIATEARAKFNAIGIHSDHGRYQGLTIWSPNMNIFRDPRWGRGQETYGEDPYLTGTLATAFVRGLQGPDEAHPKTLAAIKHFAVHSGPEAGRHGLDIDVSPYDLSATYLPAFRKVVTEAHPGAVMCGYNSLHGVPVCASPRLLGDLLRTDWGFDGFVVTDCDSIYDMAWFHFFRPTLAENAAAALDAGTDLNCGNSYAALGEAVRNHLIPERSIDLALARLWKARDELGLDGHGSPHDGISESQVHAPAAAALALRAARESVVLLKNDGSLPLRAGARVAIIGPNADSLTTLQANYHGTSVGAVTPLAGLRRLLGADRVRYAQGSTLAAGVMIPIPETRLRTGDGQAGLLGEYFDSPDFSGKPVFTRVDRTVELDLYNAVPAGLGRGNYSIRWSGLLDIPAAGDFDFAVALESCWDCSDRHDAAQLFIDEQPVIGKSGSGTVRLHFDSAGLHSIRLEFRHVGNDWGVRLQWQAPAEALLAEALTAAANADVIVACVGLSPDIEGEELPIAVPGFERGDRTDLSLPAPQEELLRALGRTGKPLIVVVMSGSAVAINWASEHANAILQTWYPGEAGGTALAEILTGAYNPSGRLPVTIYKSAQDLPPFVDYRMAGRTYRYFSGTPLYAFGHGLSYTRFAYRDLKISRTGTQPGQSVRVTATVTNEGDVDGDEVAQLYLTPPHDESGLRISLAGFRRVRLEAKASTRVSFELTPRDLSVVDSSGRRSQVAATFGVHVGGSQPIGTAGVRGEISILRPVPLPD